MSQSELQQAIARGLADDGDLSDELFELDHDDPIESREDAEAICLALETVPWSAAPRDDAHSLSHALHSLVAFFQQVESSECDAFDVMSDRGLSAMYQIFDDLIEDAGDYSDTLMFMMKVFNLYGSEEGARRIVAAIHGSFNSDGYMWSIILGALSPEHPQFEYIVSSISDPLPDQFLAIALLDCVNQAAINGTLDAHPFDNEDGKQRLEKWLASSNPEEFSYAHSATASLPFISNPQRDQLLALAMDHADSGVQLEAGWASSKLGSESGLKFLARKCQDVKSAVTAQRYLEELERDDLIPEETQEPDFQAMAEMCAWLAHPQEFGKPPDDIQLADSREIFWPPTDDKRWLWVFKYTYKADEMDDEEFDDELDEDEELEDDIGYGMVGSITFALFGETTADLTAEDVYALHCCWELEMNDDERAPEERTVEAGRRILSEYDAL